MIKKKDPPLLTMNEMKEIVSCVDQFMCVLEKDKKQAKVNIFSVFPK